MVKMTTSRNNYSTSKWFNTRLFTINGNRLKFYLKGYSVEEFYSMVKIIEAYGGELSDCDDADTLIFCEPSHAVGSEMHERYDVNYFRDSIATLQLQNLKNYKLQGSTGVSNSGEEDSENDNNTIKNEIICLSGSESDEDSDVSKNNMADILQRATATKRKKRWHGRPCTVFTEVENGAIVKWLIKKRMVPREGLRKPWDALIKDKVLERDDLTVWKLMGHYDRTLKHSPALVSYIKQLKMSHQVQKLPRYTEQENQALIDFLIKKDVIHRATSLKVWAKCLKECKASLNPTRTHIGLHHHFTRRLYAKYSKYTDDPVARRKFMGFIARQ